MFLKKLLASSATPLGEVGSLSRQIYRPVLANKCKCLGMLFRMWQMICIVTDILQHNSPENV